MHMYKGYITSFFPLGEKTAFNMSNRFGFEAAPLTLDLRTR
jgi:hypothetical protein